MKDTIKYLTGSVGPSGYGSKSTAEQVTDNCRFGFSYTAIITGATSGIGAETARVLAKRGVRVIMPARNLKAAEEMKDSISSEFPDSEIIVLTLDLSSLRSVRNFVAEFEALNLPLNLLINNAGKFSHRHRLSEDGIETTFATNYLGHFLLTKLLMKNMIETAKITGVQGRIVNVSSGIHTWFSGNLIRSVGQITLDKSQYDATRAYAISKIANVLLPRNLLGDSRWMCGHTRLDRIRNEVFRERLLVANISDKVREGRLRWFGHVRRRRQSAPVRRIELLTVEGKRGRGRPRLTWEEQIRHDLAALHLSEDMIYDRSQWRRRKRCTCFLHCKCGLMQYSVVTQFIEDLNMDPTEK
ncbi:hypothetical protein R6Q59_011066 [Mikania micrantha]